MGRFTKIHWINPRVAHANPGTGRAGLSITAISLASTYLSQQQLLYFTFYVLAFIFHFKTKILNNQASKWLYKLQGNIYSWLKFHFLSLRQILLV